MTTLKPIRGKQEAELFNLLCKGKFSVVDIARRLYISDPRGVISHLNKKGYAIQFETRRTERNIPYKVYFVNQE